MKILSFGGGINSTAILALTKLGKIEVPDKIIFADTGAENPKTYCHIKTLSKQFDIITVKSDLLPLYDYCMEKRIIPSRMLRWCTDKWKIQPINKYLKDISNYKLLIGFCKGEEHRRKNFTEAQYPLIDQGIIREDCIKLIKSASWEVPPKSGCYFCPYQKKMEWQAMKENSPDLFSKALSLELNCQRKDLFLYGDKPLAQFESAQTRLSPLDSYQHCICGAQ